MHNYLPKRLRETASLTQTQPTALGLPFPSAEMLDHSAKLCARIRAEIAANPQQSISFSEYFELCQYAPGLGYYSAGSHKFGVSGDFVTSPELGDAFALCLANALAPALRELGPDAMLLEVGCGSGQLAVDLLRALDQLQALPGRYGMLERSADLRARQHQLLTQAFSDQPDILPRLQWLDAPPNGPWSGVLIGNEIVDALAVERFEMQAGMPLQLRVASCTQAQLGDSTKAESAFDYVLGAPLALPTPLADYLQQQALPDGYRSEVLASLQPWFQGLVEQLQAGLVLFCDYGFARDDYYRASRNQGTLVCHYQQRMLDAPFLWPGLLDLSASVEFTALAEAGDACGWQLCGYLSQAEFLLHTGLESIAATLPDLSSGQRLARNRELRMLTQSQEMGERFQIMAWQRELPERGLHPVFERLGWRHRL